MIRATWNALEGLQADGRGMVGICGLLFPDWLVDVANQDGGGTLIDCVK